MSKCTCAFPCGGTEDTCPSSPSYGQPTLADQLTAAEQRNAEHESMLRHFASCADVRQVGTLAMGYVAALTKPTESGANE